MAPTPVTSPTRRFVLTSLDVGTNVETNVALSSLLPVGYTTDQALRPSVMENARSLRDANPGVVYLLYSPSNGGAHTDGDRVWDSRIND